MLGEKAPLSNSDDFVNRIPESFPGFGIYTVKELAANRTTASFPTDLANAESKSSQRLRPALLRTAILSRRRLRCVWTDWKPDQYALLLFWVTEEFTDVRPMTLVRRIDEHEIGTHDRRIVRPGRRVEDSMALRESCFQIVEWFCTNIPK